MAYLSKYNTPKVWKKFKENPERPKDRNGSKYQKTMLPGKPSGISVPLHLILTKYSKDALITSKGLKASFKNILINDKKPKDLRAGLAVGDKLTIEDKSYLFLIINCPEGINYKLEALKVDQKCIRRVLSVKNTFVLETLSGLRIPHSLNSEKEILPGSVYIEGKVKDLLSGEILKIIPLTGKYKYQEFDIVSTELLEGSQIKVKTSDDKNFLITNEDMVRRRYLTLI